jgi:hypothetical protein
VAVSHKSPDRFHPVPIVTHIPGRFRPVAIVTHIPDRFRPVAIVTHIPDRFSPVPIVTHIPDRFRPVAIVTHIPERFRPVAIVTHISDRFRTVSVVYQSLLDNLRKAAVSARPGGLDGRLSPRSKLRRPKSIRSISKTERGEHLGALLFPWDI